MLNLSDEHRQRLEKQTAVDDRSLLFSFSGNRLLHAMPELNQLVNAVYWSVEACLQRIEVDIGVSIE